LRIFNNTMIDDLTQYHADRRANILKAYVGEPLTDDLICKAFDAYDLIKGLAAAEGEERTWGGKKYKKVGGKWVPASASRLNPDRGVPDGKGGVMDEATKAKKIAQMKEMKSTSGDHHAKVEDHFKKHHNAPIRHSQGLSSSIATHQKNSAEVHKHLTDLGYQAEKDDDYVVNYKHKDSGHEITVFKKSDREKIDGKTAKQGEQATKGDKQESKAPTKKHLSDADKYFHGAKSKDHEGFAKHHEEQLKNKDLSPQDKKDHQEGFEMHSRMAAHKKGEESNNKGGDKKQSNPKEEKFKKEFKEAILKEAGSDDPLELKYLIEDLEEDPFGMPGSIQDVYDHHASALSERAQNKIVKEVIGELKKDQKPQKKHSTEHITKHAENTSSDSLKSAAEKHKDPHVKDAAKRELERRSKDEAEGAKQDADFTHSRKMAGYHGAVEKQLSGQISDLESSSDKQLHGAAKQLEKHRQRHEQLSDKHLEQARKQHNPARHGEWNDSIPNEEEAMKYGEQAMQKLKSSKKKTKK
jgi:hypothetical protein